MLNSAVQAMSMSTSEITTGLLTTRPKPSRRKNVFAERCTDSIRDASEARYSTYSIARIHRQQHPSELIPPHRFKLSACSTIHSSFRCPKQSLDSFAHQPAFRKKQIKNWSGRYSNRSFSAIPIRTRRTILESWSPSMEPRRWLEPFGIRMNFWSWSNR